MKAFILIDLQNDFLPGGSLAVKEGHKIIPIINALLEHPFDLKVATKDWHPKHHKSFAINHGKQPGDKIMLGELEQVLWPVHCVQNTQGAEFPSALKSEHIHQVFYKGVDPEIDSYSAFYDNDDTRATGLAEYLKKHRVTDVFLAGLATDYCVFFSAMDAKQSGFNTYVIQDACKGIDIVPGDSQRALDKMASEGIHIVTASSVIDAAKLRHTP